MGWLRRGSGSVACRRALIAACALAACAASGLPRTAAAEPFAGRSGAAYNDAQRAQELYLDGVEKLSAGHTDFARETFSSVIARFPSTPAAADARRQLGKLDGRASAPQADIGAPVTGSLNVPSIGDTRMSGGPAATQGPAWDREMRRNAAIQSRLRLEAGDRVFFSAGSAELGMRARMALGAQAQWLMRWHEFEAAIEGHADEPGGDQENLLLSQRRAEAVRQRLIAEGVEPSRIAVVPLGRSVRIATCSDAGCHAQNRRAVTLVLASGTTEKLGLVSTPPLSAALAPAAAGEVAPAAVAFPAGSALPGHAEALSQPPVIRRPAGMTR